METNIIFRWLSNQHHQVKAKDVKVLKVHVSEVKINLIVEQQVPTQSTYSKFTKYNTQMEHPLLQKIKFKLSVNKFLNI